MSFLMRLFFILCFGLLAGTGVVAGLNIVSQDQSIQQSTENIVNDENSIFSSDTSVQNEIVTGEPFITTDTALPVQKKVTPELTATAYLVGDVKSGKIFISSRSDDILPVASISKLVTAIIATNTISPTTTVPVASSTLISSLPQDNSGIHGGESFELQEILKPLLLSSSNIAAEAIASTTDRENFLGLMSNTAWEIGMPKTFFADPSGIDPRNVASAKDLFSLAQYLYQFRPDILAITRNIHADFASTTNHDSHSIKSTHPFVIDSRFIGGKTGRTLQAGETMLTLLNIDEKPIAFIVMHSDFGARQADTEVLIRKYLKMIQS